MPEDRAGRNDPCPCGSGKKYKKCCWGKEPPARDTAVPGPSLREIARQLRAIEEEPGPLDEISNGAVDAIQAGKYDEAEKLCERLLQEYPEIIDSYDRLGMLREAQGRFREAAEHYTRALEVVRQHPDDYDPVWIGTFERRRDEALAKAPA